MYMIELDISHEMSAEEVVAYAAEFDCTAQLIEEFGPAGGNPLYMFTSYDYAKLVECATDVLYDEELAIERIESVPV